MAKAEVINMADHRELINPMCTIGFAFETVLTEAELERRIQLISDLIYTLGGKLEDGRGEAVELTATDSGTGDDWEGGGSETKYARPRTDGKMKLEEVLEYFTVSSDGSYRNRPEFVVMYTNDVFGGKPFEITQVYLNKRGGIKTAFSYDDEKPMTKRDFQDGSIEILHRVRPF